MYLMEHLRVRDFFEGYSVRVLPVHGRWLVQLMRPDFEVDHAQTYVSMQGALESAEEWMRTLVDDTLVPERTSAEARRELQEFLQEVAARVGSGEMIEAPDEVADLIERDRLREWLERQMSSETL